MMGTANDNQERERAWLKERLELNGTRESAWLEGEFALAQAICERDPEADVLWADHERVDALLDEALAPEAAPPGLATRIVAHATDQALLPSWLSGFRLVLGGGAVSAAASVIGFVVMTSLLGAPDAGYGNALDVANGGFIEGLAWL